MLDRVIRASLRVVAWGSIGFALVLTLLGTELMKLAFGGAFASAGATFKWLVWFLPATLLSGHARWFMIAAKRQEYVFVAQVAGVIASVAVGIPLVRYSHSEGAAIAMVAGAIAVWVTAQLCAIRYVRAIPGVAVTLLPGAFALLLMAGVVWSRIDLTRWILTPVVAIIYFGVAPLVDTHLISDLRSLARAKSDVGAAP